MSRDSSLAGFDAFRFDFLGRGDSDHIPRMTFATAAADLRRVGASIRQQGHYRAIHAVGLCFGAAVALYCWDEFDCLALWSPDVVETVSPLRSGIRLARALPRVLRRMFRLPAIVSVLKRPRTRRRLRATFTGAPANAYDLLPPVSSPMAKGKKALILLGRDDPSRQLSTKIYRRHLQMLQIECRTVAIPLADHNFCGVVQTQSAIAETLRWLGELNASR